MGRFVCAIVAAITLSAFGSNQELRGSQHATNEVPQVLELIEYNHPTNVEEDSPGMFVPVVAKVTHAPPVWAGANDIMTPGTAWIATLGFPLVGIPCMVK